MGESDALVFLANVALHNQGVPSPTYYKRKDRPKELKIINLDGHNVAEINDLRSLSMNVLFKIFIEKFEDTNRHCTVFVCKFGLRNGCGTKFMDVKENRIHRLEHLIQCHLLEHLLKTKSGSFVEIPKRSFEKMKTKTVSNTMTEIDNSSGADFSLNIHNAANHANQSNRPVIQRHVASQNVRPINDITKTMAASIELTNNDHNYAATEEKRSSRGAISSEEYPVIKSDEVNISELCPSNCECSKELLSFMMYETLHQPSNIFIIDGANLIVEQLPIVGSEVEVSTNCDMPVIENLIASADKIHYTCTFCTSSYFTKKSLNLHIRKKHGDFQNFCRMKTVKRKIICSDDDSTRDSKASKVIQIPPASEDVNNNWFVELKENMKVNVDHSAKNESSILKTALMKNQIVKRPIINISNVWNNIHVQYV